MHRWTTWAFRLGFVAASAGALLSRDACFGGPKRPPPDPPPAQTATAQPAAPATAQPAATPAGTFATPP